MKTRAALLTALLFCLAPAFVGGAAAGTLEVPDDYATVSQALRAAGPGDTIRLGPGVHRPFVVYQKSDIQLVGAPGHRIEYGLRVSQSVGITLRGLRVVSSVSSANAVGPLGGDVGGIRVSDSAAVLVAKCRVTGSIGIKVTDSDGVTLSRNRVKKSVVGIAALDTTGFTLRRNLVLEPGATGIEVSGDGLVRGNKVAGGASVGGAIHVVDGEVEVLQNRIEDVVGDGIVIRAGDQHRIERNEVLDAEGDGIECVAGSEQRVDGNLVKRTAQGIRMGEACTASLLVDNRVKKVRRSGIWIEGAANQVVDNRVKRAADFGIDLLGKGNVVSGNRIEESGIGAIDGVEGNTLVGNDCPDDPEACS